MDKTSQEDVLKLSRRQIAGRGEQGNWGSVWLTILWRKLRKHSA